MSVASTLVISRFGPDQAGGAALRNLQNIRALARLGPVDVLTLGEEGSDGAIPVVGVREWQRFALKGSLGSMVKRLMAKRWLWRPGIHPLLDRYHLPAAEEWLRGRVRQQAYRCVVIEELALARYGELCRTLGCRVIFDAHNVEGALRAELAGAAGSTGVGWVQRAKNGLLTDRLSQEEQRAVRGADQLWACSAKDATDLAGLYGKRATVVPNAVDVDTYRPRPAATEGDWRDRPLTILFTGSFSYLPNSVAALRLIREILPVVRLSHPSARVCLVGRDPTPAMLAAAKDDAGVLVTGAVPSVLPYFHSEAVVVVPLSFGSGTRLKILEAFAAGLPVVSTAKGAEGIDAKDDCHLLLREESVAIAAAAVQLWDDAALRWRILVNAGLLVESQYSWPVAAARIASSLGMSEKLEAIG